MLHEEACRGLWSGWEQRVNNFAYTGWARAHALGLEANQHLYFAYSPTAAKE